LHKVARIRSDWLEVLPFARSPFMAPVAVEMIGKKKRRRGKKAEASSSVAAPGVCEPKQRKRRA
jgi:hypothetical protein